MSITLLQCSFFEVFILLKPYELKDTIKPDTTIFFVSQNCGIKEYLRKSHLHCKDLQEEFCNYKMF